MLVWTSLYQPRIRTLECSKFYEMMPIDQEHPWLKFFRNSRFMIVERPQLSSHKRSVQNADDNDYDFFFTHAVF